VGVVPDRGQFDVGQPHAVLAKDLVRDRQNALSQEQMVNEAWPMEAAKAIETLLNSSLQGDQLDVYAALFESTGGGLEEEEASISTEILTFDATTTQYGNLLFNGRLHCDVVLTGDSIACTTIPRFTHLDPKQIDVTYEIVYMSHVEAAETLQSAADIVNAWPESGECGDFGIVSKAMAMIGEDYILTGKHVGYDNPASCDKIRVLLLGILDKNNGMFKLPKRFEPLLGTTRRFTFSNCRDPTAISLAILNLDIVHATGHTQQNGSRWGLVKQTEVRLPSSKGMTLIDLPGFPLDEAKHPYRARVIFDSLEGVTLTTLLHFFLNRNANPSEPTNRALSHLKIPERLLRPHDLKTPRVICVKVIDNSCIRLRDDDDKLVSPQERKKKALQFRGYQVKGNPIEISGTFWPALLTEVSRKNKGQAAIDSDHANKCLAALTDAKSMVSSCCVDVKGKLFSETTVSQDPEVRQFTLDSLISTMLEHGEMISEKKRLLLLKDAMNNARKLVQFLVNRVLVQSNDTPEEKETKLRSIDGLRKTLLGRRNEGIVLLDSAAGIVDDLMGDQKLIQFRKSCIDKASAHYLGDSSAASINQRLLDENSPHREVFDLYKMKKKQLLGKHLKLQKPHSSELVQLTVPQVWLGLQDVTTWLDAAAEDLVRPVLDELDVRIDSMVFNRDNVVVPEAGIVLVMHKDRIVKDHQQFVDKFKTETKPKAEKNVLKAIEIVEETEFVRNNRDIFAHNRLPGDGHINETRLTLLKGRAVDEATALIDGAMREFMKLLRLTRKQLLKFVVEDVKNLLDRLEREIRCKRSYDFVHIGEQVFLQLWPLVQSFEDVQEPTDTYMPEKMQSFWDDLSKLYALEVVEDEDGDDAAIPLDMWDNNNSALNQTHGVGSEGADDEADGGLDGTSVNEPAHRVRRTSTILPLGVDLTHDTDKCSNSACGIVLTQRKRSINLATRKVQCNLCLKHWGRFHGRARIPAAIGPQGCKCLCCTKPNSDDVTPTDGATPTVSQAIPERIPGEFAGGKACFLANWANFWDSKLNDTQFWKKTFNNPEGKQAFNNPEGFVTCSFTSEYAKWKLNNLMARTCLGDADIYGLYRAVQVRGGFKSRENARSALNMTEIFGEMANYKEGHKFTDVGNQLLNHYADFLLHYELAHPDDATIQVPCHVCKDDANTSMMLECDTCKIWSHPKCQTNPLAARIKRKCARRQPFACDACYQSNTKTLILKSEISAVNGKCEKRVSCPQGLKVDVLTFDELSSSCDNADGAAVLSAMSSAGSVNGVRISPVYRVSDSRQKQRRTTEGASGSSTAVESRVPIEVEIHHNCLDYMFHQSDRNVEQNKTMWDLCNERHVELVLCRVPDVGHAEIIPFRRVTPEYGCVKMDEFCSLTVILQAITDHGKGAIAFRVIRRECRFLTKMDRSLECVFLLYDPKQGKAIEHMFPKGTWKRHPQAHRFRVGVDLLLLPQQQNRLELANVRSPGSEAIVLNSFSVSAADMTMVSVEGPHKTVMQFNNAVTPLAHRGVSSLAANMSCYFRERLCYGGVVHIPLYKPSDMIGGVGGDGGGADGGGNGNDSRGDSRGYHGNKGGGGGDGGGYTGRGSKRKDRDEDNDGGGDGGGNSRRVSKRKDNKDEQSDDERSIDIQQTDDEMDHDDESDDEGDCAEAESVPAEDSLPKTKSVPAEDSLPKTKSVPAEDSLPKTKSVPAEDSLPKTVQSFPLDMGGGLIIEHLGVVDPNLQMRGKQKGTHTLPIGYCSTRMSSRCDDPDSGQTTKWTQEIISKDGYIMFKLTAAEGLREPIVANNPTAAWKEVLVQKNMHRKIKSTPTKSTAISGPYFFGYKHPKVVALIQALDGASRSVKPRGGKRLTF